MDEFEDSTPTRDHWDDAELWSFEEEIEELTK